MSELLLYYQRPEPATWVFLSSFLVIGLFFMFHRFWSMRNLDVLLLLLLAPGLMMVYEGRKLRFEERNATEYKSAESTEIDLANQRNQALRARRYATAPLALSGNTTVNNEPSPWLTQAIQNAVDALAIEEEPAAAAPVVAVLKRQWSADELEFWGFICLLSVSALILIRLIIDATLVRRPLLEPNLSIGGLTFLGISLFLFLMANVATSTIEEQRNQGPRLGPGYPLLNSLPDIQTTPSGLQSPWQSPKIAADEGVPSTSTRSLVAKILAITANLAIVLGIVAVGYWHFDDTKMGIGAATLYLLLPYTAQMTGRIDHVLPAAMLVWGLLLYRLPILSGCFLGFAAGLVYYPLFLLPLWLSFYWHRGVGRFLIGFLATITVLASLLLIGGTDRMVDHLQHMFGLWLPAMDDLQGVWGLGWHPNFRLPVLVAFCILSFGFIWWPAQKNLATLMSGSAAIMAASQFWHGFGGGLYMAWFLPLVLLTIFRPNLDDRVALEVVGDGWFSTTRRRRPRPQLGLVQGNDAA